MTSSTDSTYNGNNNYNRFNYYYFNSSRNIFADLKIQKVKKEPLPKKEEVHMFDIKDLDLKEE